MKYFDIKPLLRKIKNPQENARMERVRQIIFNILVTKYLAIKVFNYIYPWDETLAYMAYEIRASYHFTIQATPGQSVF